MENAEKLKVKDLSISFTQMVIILKNNNKSTGQASQVVQW